MFFHVGVTSVAKYATFTDSVADLKAVLRDEFGLDSNASLADRVKVTSLVVAWSSASARMEKAAELEAEQEMRRLPKQLSTNDFMAMKVAFEKRWWPIEERETPGRCYLEQRAAEIEQDDVRAEALTSVVSREEDAVQDELVPVFDAAGTMRMRKSGTTVQPPTGPESLRSRVGLLGNGLIMLGLRHTNRPMLADLTPQLFQAYVGYLLGEWVYGLVGKDSDGTVIATPAWNQVLAYELQVRRRAWQLVVSEQVTFAVALKRAWNDPITKERYFTTPMAISGHNKRHREGDGGDDSLLKKKKDQTKKEEKGKKGAGKGAKGSKSPPVGVAARNKDGKALCYAYNSPEGCQRRKKCSFLHVCGRCFGEHPIMGCTAQAPEGSS